MFKKYLAQVLIVISLYGIFGLVGSQELHAQVFGGSFTNKWLWVSSLREYFSSTGVEIEYGRRGRGPYQNTDQDDGLRYPAQYVSQDHNVGKAIWIGTTDFVDPTNGIKYAHKVVPLGRATLWVNSAVYPVEFRLIGRSVAPMVIVDNARASDLDAYDLDLNGSTDVLHLGVDQLNPNLPADRMIYNITNTPIGITIYRKVLAFTQQYNDNYYIYEYVFKNTGLIDNAGGKIIDTLKDVVFDFRNRFADANDAYIGGWGFPGNNYGKNTINDVIGQDANHTLSAPNDFRATISYYGPTSSSTGVSDDIGGPCYRDGHILCGVHFVGEMVLHADSNPHDTTDDPKQPTTTQFMGSDGPIENTSVSSPFNASTMTQQYQNMTAGHPTQTHAEQLGEDGNGWPTNFGNTWGGNPGGYQIQQGFGPYTLHPDDSIRIVVAEAIAGINREKNIEVASNWWTWYHYNNKNGTVDLPLPNGSTTKDGNIYKNSWVFTGKDSLYQTFRRARANYNGGYNIPQPPPPPDNFTVKSGGDRISLTWSNGAESWPNFDGYRVYRAITKTDTAFELIFSCNKSNKVNSYDDRSAKRGFNYFYYIQTVDDGSTNTASASYDTTSLNIPHGEPLVSSMFYTMTNKAASLLRPAGNSLSEIRVVPNPYNIRAQSIQFGTDISIANQLAFFGLPPYCVIKIYTEIGDLIKTINHTNGSGDERWDSKTSSGQIVVSGLYIAYFEITQDTYDETNGKLIFRKGENIFRKFIIIR